MTPESDYPNKPRRMPDRVFARLTNEFEPAIGKGVLFDELRDKMAVIETERGKGERSAKQSASLIINRIAKARYRKEPDFQGEDSSSLIDFSITYRNPKSIRNKTSHRFITESGVKKILSTESHTEAPDIFHSQQQLEDMKVAIVEILSKREEI